MAKNQTYKREVIDGKEVMILIEEEIIEDEKVETPTVEELKTKVEELQQQLTEVQTQIDILKENEQNNIPY